MLRHERRLLLDCLLIGAALTALVISCDAAGLLRPLEDGLYDVRCRLCQHFTPPPTDKLVHLDIDDAALETIGRWPWPRARVARILDEVRLAGPKVVEMDVLLSEPQPVQYEPIGDAPAEPATPAAPSSAPAPPPSTAPSTLPALASLAPVVPAAAPATSPMAPAPSTQPIAFRRIDNDAELAAAIRRLGNVIVPATLEPPPPRSRLFQAMVAALEQDLEADADALAVRLSAAGAAVPAQGLGETFFVARRDAIDARLRALDPGPAASLAQVQAKLLPRTPANVHSGLTTVLAEQWEKYRSACAYRRFAIAPASGATGVAHTEPVSAPLPQFSQAAAGGAFVHYAKFGSPIIRRIPLLLEQDARLYPQMGLAMACRMLDADPRQMRVTATDITIPRGGGEPPVVIPLAPPRVSTTGVSYAALMDIPWFGGRDWETMYDWPDHRTSRQHLPINHVWEACVAREKIVANNRLADDAICAIYEIYEPDHLRRYLAAPPAADDSAARERLAAGLLKDYADYLDPATRPPPDPKDDKTQKEKTEKFYAAGDILRQVPALNRELERELAADRRRLAGALRGNAVLMGWTATAAIADFIPTPLHDKCPGAVVHGVVFNGIMTGHLWRRLPWWVSAAAAALLGLLTALAVGRLPPFAALGVALLIAAAFAVVDGTVLFDYGDRILDAAAPLMVVGVVWAGGTLTRVVAEAAERRRITGRFRSYVDPKLVNYVLENPDVRFDGETREMTVVFTDLAGFTALSEKLGEKIVPVLNELLGELVPVIRDHHQGYVNKFLGDGIMFFFNAPVRTHSHAADAVATVLDMRLALDRYNETLRQRGLPPLSMRAGIVTGEMIVGDAGGAQQNDYTVLGDAVNLAARLEPANKPFDTHTLITSRTAELLDGQFLVRPVARLKVVGKDESVMVYEPIAPSAAATDAQREAAKLTGDLLAAFAARRFEDTVAVIARLEAAAGASKLTALYRDLCEQYLREPPDESFDGTVVLTQK